MVAVSEHLLRLLDGSLLGNEGHVRNWHAVGSPLDGDLHLGGDGNVDHRWLQVGSMRHLGDRVSELWHQIFGGIGKGLFVLVPDLALVSLDLVPAFSFSSSMLVLHVGLDDLIVIANVRDRYPDRVEAPSAASLNHHAHSESVNKGENRTLVANNGQYQESNAIVVDVELTFGLQSLGVPDDEDDDGNEPETIANETVARLQIHRVDIDQGGYRDDHANENGPESWAPSLHRSPSQGEVLQRSNVSVGKLKAKKHEGSDPQIEVPLVDFVRGVVMAVSIARQVEFVQVVTLLESVQEEKIAVVGLEHELGGKGVFLEVGGVEEDGFRVCGFIACAVAREVFLLAEHNNAAHKEDDGGNNEQLLERSIAIVAVSEGVAALAVDQVDEGPAVDGQSHEHHELS